MSIMWQRACSVETLFNWVQFQMDLSAHIFGAHYYKYDIYTETSETYSYLFS